MSFHLHISAQRDPASVFGSKNADREKPRSRVATFEIVGELSEPDRQQLQTQVEALGSAEADTIIIDLLEVSAADQLEAKRFCEWISHLRREGKPLHVAARQAEVYGLLHACGHEPDWLLPFTGVETGVARKVISVDGLNPSA